MDLPKLRGDRLTAIPTDVCKEHGQANRHACFGVPGTGVDSSVVNFGACLAGWLACRLPERPGGRRAHRLPGGRARGRVAWMAGGLSCWLPGLVAGWLDRLLVDWLPGWAADGLGVRVSGRHAGGVTWQGCCLSDVPEGWGGRALAACLPDRLVSRPPGVLADWLGGWVVACLPGCLAGCYERATTARACSRSASPPQCGIMARVRAFGVVAVVGLSRIWARGCAITPSAGRY